MPLFLLLIGFVVVSVALVLLLLRKDRGAREPVGALWEAAGFGLLATLLAMAIESLFVPRDIPTQGLNGMSMQMAFLMFMGVGIVEEGLKFWPLALFVWKKRYFDELTDGVVYFAIAGLTFGLTENILYTLLYGPGVGLMRLIMLPIFHGATTGMIGYFLARAKLNHKPLSSVLPIFFVVAVLHGLYDFGLASGIMLLVTFAFMLTLLLTTGFFLYFMRAVEDDKAMGLEGAQNNFCEACGAPNPKHTRYCEHCGHKA